MKSIRKSFAASLLAAGALVTAAAGITIATAADDATAPPPPGPHGWHHHGEHGEGHLLSKLNLTDDQKASVKSIMSSAWPQMKSVHEQMRANELKLQQTAPTDANYAGVVSEVSAASGTLHAQMVTDKANTWAQVYKVLTPAQQTQLKSLQAEMAQKQAAWRERQPGGPPPPL